MAFSVLNTKACSLLMCADAADLRQRVNWDESPGGPRRRLLSDLQRLSTLTLTATYPSVLHADVDALLTGFIPSSIMIPPRRFSTLLSQALTYQRQACIYHNGPTPLPIPGSSSFPPSSSAAFSLYRDHVCDKNDFPRVTTMILEGHTDEVWNLKWSHDGQFLATASKDQTAIIWKIGVSIALYFYPRKRWCEAVVVLTAVLDLQLEEDVATRECAQVYVLRDHDFEVGCLAWSLDDKVLLTGADHVITRWNTQVRTLLRFQWRHVR
jgi:WD repeat-containing protein 26